MDMFNPYPVTMAYNASFNSEYTAPSPADESLIISEGEMNESLMGNSSSAAVEGGNNPEVMMPMVEPPQEGVQDVVQQ